MLRLKSGRVQRASQDARHLNFFGPPSLAFGAGTKEHIYFEVEFCGVNKNDAFDIAALPDIHVGIHGDQGYHYAWTVTWDWETLQKRLCQSLSVMTDWLLLTTCCVHATVPAKHSKNCLWIVGLYWVSQSTPQRQTSQKTPAVACVYAGLWLIRSPTHLNRTGGIRYMMCLVKLKQHIITEHLHIADTAFYIPPIHTGLLAII